MKAIIAIIALFGLTSSAQTTYIVYDSRTNATPTNVAESIVVDLSDTSSQVTRRYAAQVGVYDVVPFVLDSETGLTVPYNASWSNQLSAILSNAFPATVRERTTPTTKEERKSRSDNLRAAPGWAQGKEEVARLAEEIELLNERIERLESK